MLNPRRMLAIILIAAAALSLFSCAGNQGGNVPADSTDVQNDITGTTAKASDEPKTNDELLSEVRASMPKVDYGGYVFHVLGRDSTSAHWVTSDVFSEGENGDTINDAVFARNVLLEDALNIKIRDSHEASASETAKKIILANDDTFDVVTDGVSYLAKSLATSGYLIDYNEISPINLKNDWWDHAMTEGLSIANRVYFITGDISIMDNYGTWCMLFNKEILRKFSSEDPYELVDSGKWTLSKMYEIAKEASLDLDGDGKMGDWDQYGLMSESYNTYGFWLGSGEKITTKDADDLPQLTIFNDRSASVLEQVLNIQLDTTTTITGSVHSDAMKGINSAYKQGNGLFIFGGMWLISDFRDSDVDFGILPAPKFEEAQDKYYNIYSYTNCTAYSVPVTASDPERTGTILESMAALSKYTLTPAYYDISLEGKFLRDEKSKDMIDLILANRSFDLCALFDWGGMFSMFSSMYTTKSYDFASRYASNEPKANAAIEAFIESIQ